MRKVKRQQRTSEAKIEGLFEIVKGFNITLEDGSEKRFEAGKRKGQFVSEKDFTPEQWKALNKLEAVVPVVDEVLEDDEIAAEIITD